MSSHTRREFLKCTTLISAGAALGAVATTADWDQLITPAFAKSRQTPEQRLKALGLTLPAVGKPVATYVTAVRTGKTLYTSGHIPLPLSEGDTTPLRGKVGKDLTLEQGNAAARNVGLHLLATVRENLGSLNRVRRLVKTLGMVNSAPDFTGQSQVMNGFSDLMKDIFGEPGVGARSAVGMAALPLNAAVEIEAIFQVA